MATQGDTKVTVITGGAGGMGLATAKILGQDHHVVLADVRQDRLDDAVKGLQADGVSCESAICDITDKSSVEAMMQAATAAGQVKSLIHTAGVSPQMGDAKLIMKINALGTINITHAAFDVASDGFSLINVASMAGHLLPGFMIPTCRFKLAQTDPDRFFKKVMGATRFIPKRSRAGFSYSISKNFVIWYSKAEASRFGSKGARVVSVSPGSFDTEMGRLEEKSGSAEMLKFAALKRFGRPEEIASVIAFCASDQASYLTGVDVLCDGGVVAGITPKDMRSLGK